MIGLIQEMIPIIIGDGIQDKRNQGGGNVSESKVS